jgi:hypothetical protein
VKHELPDAKSFEDIVEQERLEWEDNILSKIQFEDDGGATNSNITLKKRMPYQHYNRQG